MTQKIELYRDGALQWRWRFIAANGRILADSAEGYKERADAVKGALAVTGLEIERYRATARDGFELLATREPEMGVLLQQAIDAADKGWYDESTHEVGFLWRSFVTEREHDVRLVEA